VEDVDLAVLAAGLDRLYPPEPAGAAGAGDVDLARAAAAVAVGGRLAVIAGGPGTGKTTTVARVLALLHEQAAARGRPPPRVGLAAPTGKAAARLAEAVHEEAGRLDLDPATRERLLAVPASTLHRLLGWRPDSQSRFRHDRSNRLPHDVVVVDETSMLSLSLMAKLLDAVRPRAQLVLVGDPEQLASVEAGAVLGDVVGPALHGPRRTPDGARRLALLDPRSAAVDGAGDRAPADRPRPGGAVAATGISDSIVVLRRVHRFGGGIAELASAVSAGDGDAVVSVLAAGVDDVRWAGADDAVVRAEITGAGADLMAAGRAGRGDDALAALGSLRVLCAHRQGPAGVATWNQRIEAWLAAEVPSFSPAVPWYAGRPLLVTSNDYELQLYNGDTGVVVDGPAGRPVAVFERKGRLWTVSPSRLADVETVHAMTVHKSQGSQFGRVVVVLPEVPGTGLTRELLYTAVTRARRHVTIVGPEAVVRAAVARPVGRASGLAARLWGS
jgi:exodeoxyribonuclease V alpha subunit